MTDEQLVSLYKDKQDRDAMSELFKRYTHLVMGLCLKYLKDEDDARDALMQIFEKLINDLPKYEIKTFKSWLFSVSKNYCLMILRRQTHYTSNNSRDLEKNPDDLMESFIPLHLFNEEENPEEMLMDAMKQLKTEQQTCIQLFYLEEKSYKEVTEITGFSMNQVKSYIQNGKRNLKIMLEARDE